jgi:hypothetical protein
VAGISRVVRVHGDCANAVGAAIAQVSGEIDQVFQGMGRADAVAAATTLAQERAVAAGADAATLQTIEVEDIPLAYLPGTALRVRVRVVGGIAAPALPSTCGTACNHRRHAPRRSPDRRRHRG